MCLHYFDVFCELLSEGDIVFKAAGCSYTVSFQVILAFLSHSLSYRLKFQSNPTLKYLYPPPSNGILTNITHALMSVPKFYVQVSKYCFFYIILFSVQYLHVFDMHMLVICVYCICISHTVSVFPLFGKWEFAQKNANVTAFLGFRL